MAVKNGALASSLLTKTSDGELLATSAAASYERLNHEFTSKFKRRLSITSGYRPYATQVTLFHSLGYPAAAVPGTSNHGLGVACDFGSGVQTYGSAEHKWMDTVGRRHGWIPLWESLGKKRNTFEPWHWVHVPSKDRYPFRKIAVTGKWDLATVYAIQRALGRAVVSTPTDASQVSLWKAIQKCINAHEKGRTKGYKPLVVDGKPGAKTYHALQVMLRRILTTGRPTADGVMGPNTIKAFQKLLNARKF